MDPIFLQLGPTGHGDLDPQRLPRAHGLTPSPAWRGERDPLHREPPTQGTPTPTHLVREAPEVSHVPADPTGPS